MSRFANILILCLVLVGLTACAFYTFKREKGQYYTWQKGDDFTRLAKRFGITEFEIYQANGIIDPADISEGTMIFIPVEPPDDDRTAVRFPDDRPGFKLYGRKLIWPSEGRVTSCFGQRWGRPHEGVDLGQDQGLTIVAAAEGEVEFSGRQSGYGNTVVLNHGSAVKTLYGHADSLLVREGQRVKQGQKLAIMGKSGRSTGVHLHFEVRVKGDARNPLPYLPQRETKC